MIIYKMCSHPANSYRFEIFLVVQFRMRSQPRVVQTPLVWLN